MKTPMLVLLALLALVPFAQSMAQTPPAPAPDAATARFLATLAAPQVPAPGDLTPAPLFMTGCGNGPACPTGQICCFLCGTLPDDGDTSGCFGCITPWGPKGCPPVQ
ncbi:MAG: hypothetical protein ACJ76Y_31440 [Thermoanaerobaculia bacterium]